MSENFPWVAREVLAEANLLLLLFRKNLLQQVLPLRERQARQVAAPQVRRIEDVVDDARVGAVLESVLQGLEARAPLGTRHHDLAVQHAVSQLQLFQGSMKTGQFRRPVVS